MFTFEFPYYLTLPGDHTSLRSRPRTPWNSLADPLGSADPRLGNTALEALGCRLSIREHYLHYHLDWFRENPGGMSHEQGERFHQDNATMEGRYQCRWEEHKMAD